GDNYVEAEEFPQAVTAYRMVVKQYPTSPYVPAARYGVAEAYMKFAAANSRAKSPDEENYRNAIASYQEVINEHPGSEYEPHATFQIAEAYYQIRDFQNAVTWYDTVMERYPEESLAAYALYGALWSLSELGRSDEVLARGQAFIEQHKSDPDFDLQASEIQMKLGDIMYDQEKYEVAIAEYAKVLSYPNLPKFYAVKLRSLFQQGVGYVKLAETSNDNTYYEKAAAPLQAAIDRYSDDKFDMNYEFPERSPLLENSVLNKCLVHERLSQWQQARATYALIPRMSENYGRAQVLIGETYEKEGNIDQAINHYKAIAANAALGETWQSLGAIRQADLLRSAERYAEAAVAYGDVANKYPNSDYVDAARYLVGVSLYSIEPRTQETLTQSIAAFRNVVTNFPSSTNAPDAMYGIVLSTKALAEAGNASWEEVVTLADELIATFGDREEPRAQKAINSGNMLKVLALEKLGSGNVDEMIVRLKAVANAASADEAARSTAQLKVGNLLFERERFPEAIPEYQALAEMYPQGEYAALAWYQAGVSAFKVGEATTETDQAGSQAAFAQAAELTAKALGAEPDPSLLVSIYYTQGLAQSKSGKPVDAIDTLNKVTAMEAQVTDPDKKPLVFASHIELAKLYAQLGRTTDSIREYDYIAQNAEEAGNQSRALLSIADMYENQLGDPVQAAASYLRAAEVADDGRIRAQSLYRAGILLSDQKKNDEAISAFTALQNEFVNDQDANVLLMVADAGMRISDLYVLTGKVGQAMAQAEAARDRALTSGDVVQKVQAQYQVANLRARQARAVFDNTPNAANTEYKRISRQSIQEYLKAVEYAQPLDKAPDNARVYAGPALYQAGQIAYAIHGPQDLPVAVDALPRFVDYASRKLVEASDDDIKTALYYAGVAYYDLARGSENDPQLFSRSAQMLSQLAQRYPRDPEAGLWQYQVGEAYFAAQDFQRALTAYLAVVSSYPRHESAAESLYSAAACYFNLGNEAQVYATYDRLAREYPSSKFAPEATLNVANARYNEASTITNEAQRIVKLKQALDQYRRVLTLQSASPELKSAARGYAEETEELLAALEYGPIEQAQNAALGAANKEQALGRVIQRYEQLLRDYPTASSSMIAMTKIGDSYVAIEKWDQGLDWYNRLMTKFVDAQGRPMTPGNEYVSRALNYARAQYVAIRAYLVQTAAGSSR
ncbi:outer membrane protein assembly factor BamD, partial [Candidatus Poribacteria bacterium]|nr:outer membrane protein assembly factor BamD [Candidatus Poribacteria bacterium]